MTLQSAKHKYIITWLYTCAFMVFAMMIIGAITRLTESGLSMVEWRPLIGALPPLNETEWQRVFNLYQQTPEFQKKNSWMQLDDFKSIFFWEWFHRLWGRLIGLVFALPLAFFWLKKMIPQGYEIKFLGMLVLGGAQGVMGWYMVASGLVDIPAVSHFRLAAHLTLAFIIFGLLLWLAFSLSVPKTTAPRSVLHFGLLTLAALSTTIIWGALTAGLDGGLIYNNWPKMGDHLIPAEITNAASPITALALNPAGVQFTHRWLAILAAAILLLFWGYGRRHGVSFPAFNALAVMVFIQIGLGITTLLSGVNIALATAHQAGAAILIGLLVYILYRITPEKRGQN